MHMFRALTDRSSRWQTGAGIAGLLLTAFLFGGCSEKGPKIVSVTGTVTRGGKPVPNLFLNFYPEQGRPSWAQTDDQGHFVVHCTRERDGAFVGKHQVFVQMRPQSPAEEAKLAKKQLKLHPDLQAILQKYGNSKDPKLVYDVTKEGQVIDIKLD